MNNKTSFLVMFLFLLGCESRFNNGPNEEKASSSVSPKYVLKSGDTMTGTLTVPAIVVDQLQLNSSLDCVSCIVANTIAPNAIIGSKLADDSVTGSKIADDSVSSTKILDNSITNSKIADDSIQASKMQSSTNPWRILSTNSSGSVTWNYPINQYGLLFEYVSPNQIQLTPSGSNSTAMILVQDGTNIYPVRITAPLVADMTVSGAGGVDVGVEQSNQGYDVYLISDLSVLTPTLLLVQTGTVPTLPVGYPLISEKLWFVSNSHGAGNADIVDFIDVGNGDCYYRSLSGKPALSGGSATSPTVIDLSRYIPADSSLAYLKVDASNLLASLYSLTLSADLAQSNIIITIPSLGSLIGALTQSSLLLSLPIINSSSDSLYYDFNGVAGAPQLNVNVRGWKLPRRMSY